MAHHQSAADKYLDIAYELGETARRLILHLTHKEYHLMPLDVSAISTAASQIVAVTGTLGNLTASDDATQLAADQAALNAALGPLQTAVTGLQSAIASLTPPPASGFTLTPNPVNFSVGVAGSQAIVASTGTAPFTAVTSSLPQGVTFDGSALNADTTTVAGSTTVTLTDSSVPPLTGTVVVTVS